MNVNDLKSTSCKRRYQRLKAAGICVKCGREPAREGVLLCNKCTARKKQYQEKFMRKLAAGIAFTSAAGEEFTAEELEDIINGGLKPTEIARKYNISYNQALWITKHKGRQDELKGLHKNTPHAISFESWTPLNYPEGGPNKMCGYCAHYTDWRIDKMSGIMGTCEVTGNEHQRCDICDSSFDRRPNNLCIRVNDMFRHMPPVLGEWSGR